MPKCIVFNYELLHFFYDTQRKNIKRFAFYKNIYINGIKKPKNIQSKALFSDIKSKIFDQLILC